MWKALEGGRAGWSWIVTFNLLIKFTENLDTAHTKPKNRIVCGLAITLGKSGNLACHNNWDQLLISFSTSRPIKYNCFLALQGSQKRLALCSSTYLNSVMDLCHLVDSKFGCDAAAVLGRFVSKDLKWRCPGFKWEFWESLFIGSAI